MTATPTANIARSVADDTRAVVQEFLAARLAGDTERLVTLFADQVEWMLADNWSCFGKMESTSCMKQEDLHAPDTLYERVSG